MSQKSADLVRVCDGWDDYPPALRCLNAMRRSGRDDAFNLHLAWRRFQIFYIQTLTPPVAALDRFLRRSA